MSCQYCEMCWPSIKHLLLGKRACPTCEIKNHSLLFVQPLLRKNKSQERDHNGYISDDLYLSY